MSLRDFIRAHHEEIIREFSAFAKTLMPPEAAMTEGELRDHAGEILTAVVQDMGTAQTAAEQYRKSQGHGIVRSMEASGRLHATDRIRHGYTFEAVLAEFRTLRASVLRLYEESGASDIREVRRFNEAIDEAMTESMAQFTRETDLLREELNANAERNTSLVAEIRDRRAGEEKITALFRRLVSTQDDERRRISRDLHDQLGQQMTALRLTLDVLDASQDEASRRDHVGRARRLAEDIDRSLDFLAWQFRPAALEQFGFATALQKLVAGWSERFGIAAEFASVGADTLQLSLDVTTNLYRVLQEALHNVVKHAGASHVTVFLRARDHEAVLIVEDNGRGFNPADVSDAQSDDRGMGLVSMRERAALCGGALDIEAAPGRGTSIFVRIPLAADSTPAAD